MSNHIYNLEKYFKFKWISIHNSNCWSKFIIFLIYTRFTIEILLFYGRQTGYRIPCSFHRMFNFTKTLPINHYAKMFSRHMILFLRIFNGIILLWIKYIVIYSFLSRESLSFIQIFSDKITKLFTTGAYCVALRYCMNYTITTLQTLAKLVKKKKNRTSK